MRTTNTNIYCPSVLSFFMQGNDYDGSSAMQMVSRVNLALVLHNNLQRDVLILFHCAHHIEPILYSRVRSTAIPRPIVPGVPGVLPNFFCSSVNPVSSKGGGGQILPTK